MTYLESDITVEMGSPASTAFAVEMVPSPLTVDTGTSVVGPPGPPGQQGVPGPQGEKGEQGEAAPIVSLIQVFFVPGNAITGIGKAKFRFNRNATLISAYISSITAPLGGDDVYDVLMNGAYSIYLVPNARPRLLSGSTDGVPAPPSVLQVVAGDYLTVNCVGTAPTPATNTSVHIEYY